MWRLYGGNVLRLDGRHDNVCLGSFLAAGRVYVARGVKQPVIYSAGLGS